MTALIILASFALLIALAAYRSVQNWESKMRDEIRHQELRIDNLMNAIRELDKRIRY